MFLSASMPLLRPCCRMQAIAIAYLALFLPQSALTQLPFPRQKSTAENKSTLPLKQELDADVRLKKELSVDVTAIPVEELLQQVSNAQITLVAGKSCQGWKLQAHLRQRSLKTLMQALAEMLPGVWRPLTDGHTYRLEMTDVAQRRRQRWWDLFEGERAQALAAQSEATLRWMRSAPVNADQGDAHQQPDMAAANASTARQQTFFNLLNPELQQQVAQNLNDAPYYSLGSFQFGSSDIDMSLAVSLTSLPSTAQTMLARRVAGIRSGASGIHAEQGNAADVSTYMEGASVLFSNGGFALNVDMIFSDGSSIGSAFGGGPTLVPQMTAALLDHSSLPQVVAKMGNNAPVTWRELAAFQLSRVWLNPLPAQPKISRGISRAAQLHYLFAQSGMEYLADYYSHGGHDLSKTEQQRPMKQPMTDELNNLAAWRDVSWKQTPEKLYLIRNNRWYRDDRLEVPAPLLRRWYIALIALHHVQAQAQLPTNPLKIGLEREADIVSNLTRWQIMTGLRLFMPEEENLAALPEEEKLAALGREKLKPVDTDVDSGKQRREPTWSPPFQLTAENINCQYHTTLFYAHLDAGQREAVLNGQLEFNSLSTEQQQQALHLLPALRGKVARADGQPVRLRLQAHNTKVLPYIAKGSSTLTRLVIAMPE